MSSLIVGAIVTAPAIGGSVAVAASITTTDIVGPVGSGEFGRTVVVLSNGNFVITDPGFDSVSQPDVGAVRLYDGITNQVISTLQGSSANDRVGETGISQVGTGNFVVRSQGWDNGAVVDAGAVTWVNGTTGLNGIVDPSNSLVGSSLNDHVGAAITVLPAGANYVVTTTVWNNGAIADAGAFTFANGNTGISGVVSAANSLVGTTAGDGTGAGVNSLGNGNFTVRTPNWDRGGIVDAGAVTFVSGATGRTGPISAATSLVGSTAGDKVGSSVTALANGSYVVRSEAWDNLGVVDVGAVTLAPPTGITGAVTAANSLVGSITGDGVGSGGIAALANSAYVVRSPLWNNGATVDAGAVTWAPPTGITGAVSAANSLVGSALNDHLGSGGVSVINTNSSFVVRSPEWNNGATVDAGAATWVSGTTGLTGPLNAGNSLVGTHTSDSVGNGGSTALTNGNYIVISPSWNNGAVLGVGAATWGNGATGTVGAVSSANSIIGQTAGDSVGSPGVLSLKNGNALVFSWNADIAGVVDAGAVTWVNGATGGSGFVSSANSLVGSHSGDAPGSGGIATLPNGNYVIGAPSWDNGAVADVGATILGNGATGTTGPFTAANSLIGSHANDQVGYFVQPTNDGNYIVASPFWDNGAIVDAGASTWRSGSTPSAGNVTSANSLVGTAANDQVSSFGSVLLDDNSYLVVSPSYDSGPLVDSGAVTFVEAGGGGGVVTNSNSVRPQSAMNGVNVTVTSVPTASGAILISRRAENIVTLLHLPSKPNFAPLAPARLADTRPGQSTVDGVGAGTGVVPGQTTLEVTVAGRGGVAADAVAAALNVTAVDGGGDGFVTVYPCGSPQPTASNLNFTVGATVPNAVVSQLGSGGKVCIYVSQPTHLVVDVNGYFPTTSSYVSSNPARVLETRPGLVTGDGLQQGGGAAVADSVTEVQVGGRAGVPANATSAVLNVTVTEPTAAGFLTVFPCGEPRPTASNLNYVPGLTVANLVVAKLGAGGKVCLYTQSGTHLVVDVDGHFPAITTYRSLNPARLLESRAGLTTYDGLNNGIGYVPLGTVTTLPVVGRGGVPGDAETVVLNVTVTAPAAAGYVTVYPCGIAPPLASNLNFVAGQTVPNAVLVKVGTGGNVCIFNSQPTHIVVDVGGYFPPTG